MVSRKKYFIVYFTDITEEVKRMKNAETLLHALHDIIFEMDSSYVLQNVVARDEKMLFVPKEEIIGRSINEFFDDTMTQLFLSTIKKVGVSQEDETITYPSFVPDKKGWYQALFKVVGEGVDKRFIVCINDITEQRSREEKAMVYKAEAFDHSNDIVLELDRYFVFRNVFADSDNMLLIPKEKIIGRSINEIFEDQMTELFIKAMNKASFLQQEQIIEYPSLNPDEDKKFKATIRSVGKDSSKKYYISIRELFDQRDLRNHSYIPTDEEVLEI